MSTYEFTKPEVNLKYSSADIEQARQVRQSFNNRFDSNQVNWSARRAVETAEQNAPLASSSGAASSSYNVKENGRNAMQELKNTLNALRSHHQSQFNESVPPSTKESRVRATFASDEITTGSTSSPNSNSTKTAVTLNVRPLNTQAFEIERDRVCKEAGIPTKSEGGDVHVVTNLKLRLKPDANDAEVNAILEVLKKLQVDPSEDEDNGGKSRVETGADGSKYMILTHIFKEDENDPFQKFLVKLARNSLDLYRGDELAESAAEQAPGFFRLLTARLELAQSLGDWIASDEASYIKLFEGSRLAVEGILRHDIQKLVYEKMSSTMLGDFDKGELAEMLQMPFASVAARDSSINVKMAPFELLYGLLVKEGAFIDRRVKETVDAPAKVKRLPEAKQWMAQRFSTTGPEEYLSLLTSSALFLGLTSTKLRDRVVCEFARPICDCDDEDEDPMPRMIAHLCPLLVKNVAEVVSGTFFAHSFHVTADFEGIDGNIWKFVPTTPQGIVDAAKPIVAACNEDFDQGSDDEEKDNSKFTDGSIKGSQFAEMGDLDNYWPQGFFEDRAEQIVQNLAPKEYLDSDELQLIIGAQKKRTAAFRIALCVNSEDTDQKWADAVEAFGGQVFRKDGGAKKNEDSDDDMDDDDEEMGLPDPDEGYMRVAYIKRPDGRYIELVRPNSTQDAEYGLALITSCDAVVVVNTMEDIDILKPLGTPTEKMEVDDEKVLDWKAPFLFISTGGESASAETNGSIENKNVNVTATDYKSLPSNPSAAKDAADSMLAWLVSNSAKPNNGTNAAEPSAPWDFAFENPLTIP